MYNTTQEVIVLRKKLKLDITDIQTIIFKTESTDFSYHNPQRVADGFILLTEGNGFAISNSGKRYNIKAGDVLFVNRGDNYTICCPAPCSYITSELTVDTDKALLPFLHRASEQEIEKLKTVCTIWQSLEWDSYVSCRVKLLTVYYDIIKNRLSNHFPDQDIAKAITFIHQNFKTNFSGKELADYCSVSPSHLRAKFLKSTGLTITEFRDNLRISTAKEMLASKHFTVSEIATALGYCDVYHFSKVFSAQVGVSPKRWNKHQTEDL